MKSFFLMLPKSPAEIENHYFCECGNKFVDKNICPKCGNQKFYTYEDVKAYNPELFEISETEHGIECYIEYPVFSNEKIVLKKERLAILINKEVKLNQKLRENFYLYFHQIASIVKNYLKFLGLWDKRKKTFRVLNFTQSIRILELIKIIDDEVLLWRIYDEDISVEEFFKRLLKNSPKSVKKAVYEKYKKLMKLCAYNPLIDILILRVVDDINYQRELINISSNFIDPTKIDSDSMEKFLNFFRHFEQKEIVRFLRKTLQNGCLFFYIEKFINATNIKYYKSIEDTILYGCDFVEYEYHIPKVYKFENFVFKLPNDSGELKKYGDKLRNCLSNYVNVHNKKCLIFVAYKENKLLYAINFDIQKKSIVEARGFSNTRINKKNYRVIKRFFEKFREAI